MQILLFYLLNLVFIEYLTYNSNTNNLTYNSSTSGNLSCYNHICNIYYNIWIICVRI